MLRPIRGYRHCLALRRDRFPDGAPVPGTVEVAGILVPEANIDPSSADSVAAAVDAAVGRFRALQLACNAPTRLRDVGVKREDLEALSLRVNPERTSLSGPIFALLTAPRWMTMCIYRRGVLPSPVSA